MFNGRELASLTKLALTSIGTTELSSLADVAKLRPGYAILATWAQVACSLLLRLGKFASSAGQTFD